MKKKAGVPIRTLATRDATAMLNDHGEDGVKAVTALRKELHSMSDVEFVATMWDMCGTILLMFVARFLTTAGRRGPIGRAITVGV